MFLDQQVKMRKLKLLNHDNLNVLDFTEVPN